MPFRVKCNGRSLALYNHQLLQSALGTFRKANSTGNGIEPAEKAEVVANCDHLQKLKFSKVLPYAFTEHGAIQAANVLASSQAVEMGIYVVRAFVHLREALSTNADVAKRLAELEMKTESLELSHDTFSRNTRLQLRQLLDAVRELTTPPDPPKRPIGFVHPEDKPKGSTAGRGKKA